VLLPLTTMTNEKTAAQNRFWKMRIIREMKRQSKYVYVYGVELHFQHYFSYIVAVSIICGGNRSTRVKLATCRKSLTNFII
jgi:hypothetical protein